MAETDFAYRSKTISDLDWDDAPHAVHPPARYWVRIVGEIVIGVLLIAMGLLCKAALH